MLSIRDGTDGPTTHPKHSKIDIFYRDDYSQIRNTRDPECYQLDAMVGSGSHTEIMTGGH